MNARDLDRLAKNLAKAKPAELGKLVDAAAGARARDDLTRDS